MNETATFDAFFESIKLDSLNEYQNVLDCKDQFMYGPALLVCPVLEAGATSILIQKMSILS